MKNILILLSITVGLSAFGLATKKTCKGKVAKDAATASKNDLVTVEYTGWVYNAKTKKRGEQFDSSVGRAPFTFQIGTSQVIAGWDQGLIGTKKGQKCTLTIPAAEGYGARGAGDKIPPDATLQFEVEIKDIKKTDTKS